METLSLIGTSTDFCKKVNVPFRVPSSIDPFGVPESSSYVTCIVL